MFDLDHYVKKRVYIGSGFNNREVRKHFAALEKIMWNFIFYDIISIVHNSSFIFKFVLRTK